MQYRGKRPLSAGVSRPALQRARVAGWVALICASAVCLGLALAIVLLAWQGDRSLPGDLSALTLPGLAPAAAAALWGLVAVILLALGVRGLLRDASSSQPPTTPSGPSEPVSPPPRIVAVGGGHGLSTLLRGLKGQRAQLTAIVTMADDGGSSGKLRRETGLLPPGDARNCLVALAQAEPLMTQLFEYRFGRGAGLDGHAFGNLFIAAMAGISGSFEGAISQASRVLAVRGRILPSTLQNVTLCGEVR
ncbi:MAG: YvcK family protein, partial [Chloroflexi bacterium]|nr:YvcK family protein [Chloroflexota bacterium]